MEPEEQSPGDELGVVGAGSVVGTTAEVGVVGCTPPPVTPEIGGLPDPKVTPVE